MPSARAISRPAPFSSVERFFQFSLLGLVASGFFALAGTRYLDFPTLGLTAAALLWRGLFTGGWLPIVIPPRAVSAAALGYVAFYPVDFYFLSHDFFTATLHGVCFLAGIKILTAQTNRDYLYTAAVAFIELIGAALLSFEAGFFGWLALYILFAIAAFTSAEIRRGLDRDGLIVAAPHGHLGWRLALVTVASTGGILVLTGGLFLLVPRTARAAAMLFPGAPRLTGFSNVVDLGGFGEIGKDTRPVMHVLAYSRELPLQMKWRGAALSLFDGRRWSEPPLPATEVPSLNGSAEVAGPLQRSRRDGRRLLYRVDVNSSDTGTLFIAGVPEFIRFTARRLVRTTEDSFRVLPVTGEELRYEVSAYSGPRLASGLTTAERGRYLQLPPVNTRIWSQAREWAGENGPLERAARIERHLRREYVYTLESAGRPVRDPLYRFLFVTKRGYCEYFASAMAVMLRSQGIPARVATGFQSGYFNEISGLTVVRASDAHAWVEAWIEGQGWVTFDPTPSSGAPHSTGLLPRINMYFDAADSMWQQWVMAYDLGHQAVLAAKFEGALRRLSQRDLQPGLYARDRWNAALRAGAAAWAARALGIAVTLGLLALWGPRGLSRVRRRRRIQRMSRTGATPRDAGALYEHLLDILARRGFRKPLCFTPLEFARTLPAAESDAVFRFTEAYYEVRFGGAQTEDRVPQALRMAEMLQTIESLP